MILDSLQSLKPPTIEEPELWKVLQLHWLKLVEELRRKKIKIRSNKNLKEKGKTYT